MSVILALMTFTGGPREDIGDYLDIRGSYCGGVDASRDGIEDAAEEIGVSIWPEGGC